MSKDAKTPERIAMEEEAVALGVEFSPNIGDAKLKDRIDAKKAELVSVADGQDSAVTGDETTAAREFTDVEPSPQAGNITEHQLDELMQEFEKLRADAKKPISYDAYMGARSFCNRVKALITKEA